MRNFILLILFSAFTLLGIAQITEEEGLATFYSKKFNGRKTSSGEVYRHTKLTAAHPSLPFGTEVLVTNLRNDKSVIVRINDRCSPRRIMIDLSRAAASKIDMIAAGIQKVKLQVVNDSIRALHLYQEIADSSKAVSDSITTVPVADSTVAVEDNFTIQVASLSTLKSAKRLVIKLEDIYDISAAYRKAKHKRKVSYKVTIGAFATREDAKELLGELRKNYKSAFIVAK